MNHLDQLSFLSSDQIKTDSESLKTYGKDWTSYFDIKASAILFPKKTEDVVQIVQWARKNKVSLIPSGGRTGLSGAACALNGEVVVSFEKMNQIKDFNSIEQTVVCEAGVITEALQNWAVEKNLYYPVDFAARGSSQIGGNVATNAGGIKVLRYGMTRNWIAGMTVVTGAGELLKLNNALIKNATGYDLRHLMIGSEGTLGFVTEVTIQLTNPPPPHQVLFLAVPNLDAIMNIFAEFKRHTRILAFEMLSELAMKYVEQNGGLARPLENKGEHYLVIEVEKVFPEDEENILKVFESGLEKGWIVDGAMAQSDQQAKTFWRIREDITECLSRYTPYKNDISVTTSQVPDFMNEMDAVFKKSYPKWEVVWFGHIGDGNLHISILRPEGMTKEEFIKECRQVDHLLFTVVKNHTGSISAEHGVGLTKKPFLTYTRSESEIQLMKGIKKVFDPDGIMNPGKVF